MNLNSVRNIGRKAGGVALVAAGVGLGFWLCLILADILTFVYFYCSSSNVLQNYGLPEYGAKLVAVLFAGGVCYFANSILWNMIKRDSKRWIPALAGIMAVWFVIMAVVASPYDSGPFNIFNNGQPSKYYRDQYGKIHTLPRGAKVGDYGEQVQVFTKESAQEYERQTGGKKKTSSVSPSLWHRLFESNSSRDTELQMEIEKIDILPDKTILHFAVRRTDNSRLGRFYKSHGWNYLSDETGQAYDLIQDNSAYPSSDWVDSKSHKPWIDDDSSGKVALTKVVRPDETYRFTGEYPPLRPDARQLRLHDSRFAQVDLDYQLSQARIQAEIQKRNEQAPPSSVKAIPESPDLVAPQPQPPRAASQHPNPVVAAKELPIPAVSAPEPPSPPLTASAPPPVTHTGTWTRFGTTTQVDAPNSSLSVSNPAPPVRTVPAKTKPSVPVVLTGTLDSDWMVSRYPGRPELAVVWLELKRGLTDLQISARLKKPLRAHNLSDARIFTTYLTDDKGRVYRFREGSPILELYPDGTGADQYKPYSGSFYILEVGKLYMFRMSFDLLKEDVRELIFYRNDYLPMNLGRQLKEFYSSLQHQ